MSAGKVLVGVLAGVATGAILGVLFAPEKGSVTRKKIAKKSSDGVKNLKNKFEGLMDEVTDKLEESKEETAEVLKKKKGKVEDSNTVGKA